VSWAQMGVANEQNKKHVMATAACGAPKRLGWWSGQCFMANLWV
jgi:hypothetical protein